MTEERKHAILFAATILCARKLIETIESDKPNFAEEYFVDKAVSKARLFWRGLIRSFQRPDLFPFLRSIVLALAAGKPTGALDSPFRLPLCMVNCPAVGTAASLHAPSEFHLGMLPRRVRAGPEPRMPGGIRNAG